jgi:hypothetical protein
MVWMARLVAEDLGDMTYEEVTLDGLVDDCGEGGKVD